MDTAILSAGSALIGSLIGGVSTFAASWVTQRRLLGIQMRLQHAAQRQALYSDFIIEASKRFTEAWNHQAEGPDVIAGLYSALGRMRLISSDRITRLAEEVIHSVIAAYADPNKTFDEFRQRILQGREQADPLRKFTEACRDELGMQSAAWTLSK
jgi:hypothetical protein